jgi:hypothetical protein
MVAGDPFDITKAIITFFVAPIIYFPIVYSYAYIKTLKSLRKSESIEIDYRYEKTIDTTDEGLNIGYSKTGNSRTLNWSFIKEINFNDKLIYITSIDKSNFLIPKRAFLSDVNADEFIDFVKK